MPECYDTHTWSLYTTIKRLNDVGEVKFLLEHLSWEHIINLFRNKCACQTIQGDDADVDVNLHGLISVFLSWWQYKILRVINILTTRFILIMVSLFMAAMQYEYNLLERWWEYFFLTTINQSEHEMAQVLESREVVRSSNWLTSFFALLCCQYEVIVTLSES